MDTLGPGRILFWGHDEGFKASLCEILAKKNYLVTGVMLRENMFRELNEQTFDLLLIDAEKPQVDLGELLREARKTDPLIGIIIITNGRIQPFPEHCENGFYDYLVKPFTTEELFIKMSRAMRLRFLQISEHLYRSIFENAVEGIYLLTPEGRYALANKALAGIFGYKSPRELMTDVDNYNHRVFAGPELRRKLLQLLQKKEIMPGFESQIYKKDGSSIWLSESVRAMRDTEGELLYYRGTVCDITRLKKTEEELRETEKYYRLQNERTEKNRDILIEIIDEIHESYKDLEDLFMSFVMTITNSLDGKRLWKKGHSEKVASYALRIAEEMGLGDGEKRDLYLAALLHDIGKLVVSDELIDKPAKLTKEEFESIKKHSVQGAEMLTRVKQLKDIIPIVRHHHERFDGCGYPDGLKGDRIPIGARIIHLADSFDSMTAARPYRTTPGREYALQEFARCRNTQFDPDIANVALKVL